MKGQEIWSPSGAGRLGSIRYLGAGGEAPSDE